MPQDESLPRFLIRPSADEDPFRSTVLHSHDFIPAEPAYLKTRSKHPDEYAVALLDAYIPDILFAQVLAKPTISTPSLSIDEIRRQNNGGLPTLPTITLPNEFTVQLYNPESQVHVKHKASKWTGSYWEFTLPKQSFRQPTASKLDVEVARTSALPPTGVSTFRWRKDGGVVSKTSLRCTMLSTANSTNDRQARKKGGSEPDITVAIMDRLKDVTIYEPNLMRVDVEDKKGLELVLLLTATVIADIYFTPAHVSFNVSPQSATNSSPSASRRNSGASAAAAAAGRLLKTPSPPNHAGTIVNQNVLDETSRLQRQQQADSRRKAEEDRRRKQEAEAEERLTRKMLQREEKERRKREAQVAAETERVKQQFGNDDEVWQTLQRQQFTPSNASGYLRPPVPPQQPPRPLSHQLPPRQPLFSVLESVAAAGSSSGGYLAPPQAGYSQEQQPRRKSSGFLGVFGGGRESKLAKKKSSLW